MQKEKRSQEKEWESKGKTLRLMHCREAASSVNCYCVESFLHLLFLSFTFFFLHSLFLTPQFALKSVLISVSNNNNNINIDNAQRERENREWEKEIALSLT